MLPTIDPLDFLAAAKVSLPATEVFQMMANGEIFDGNDILLTTLAKNKTFRGWQYRPGPNLKWVYGDDTAFDGTYYLEGDAVISANVGTTTTQWTSTIITTGSIGIAVNINIAPKTQDQLSAISY